MILQVNQILSDPYAADFQILRGNSLVGQMAFQGSFISRHGHWDVDFYDRHFEMSHAVTVAKEVGHKGFRPYQIYANQETHGEIYRDTWKINFWTSVSVFNLTLYGTEYVKYSVDLGKKGSKHPIYRNGKQVALIERGCVVRDHLYQYRILAMDEVAAEAALIFCAYMYTLGAYQPGVKPKESIHKQISVTTNKTILAKYDPVFEELVEP